jgi:hypothetical protein
MKRLLITAIISSLLLSCGNPVQDLGSITVSIARPRAVAPDFLSQTASVRVSLSSDDGYAAPAPISRSAEPWIFAFTGLRAGTWDIAATAYNADGDEIGSGSALNQVLGVGAALDVPIAVGFSASGTTGEVRLTVSFPASTGIDYASATILDGAGNPESAPIVVTGSDPRTATFAFAGVAGGSYAAPAVYPLVLSFKRGGEMGIPAGSFVEQVEVVSGFVSGSWVATGGSLVPVMPFAASDFFDTNTSLAALEVSGGVLPGASFSSGTLAYPRGAVASVPAAVSFTAMPSIAGQSIDYSWDGGANWAEYVPGSPSAAHTVAENDAINAGADNELQVRATAPDGVTASIYSVAFSKGYMVSYDGNGGTGTAPTDSGVYEAGQAVTALGNVGVPPLALANHTLKEWNTDSGGAGSACHPGESFVMGSANATLHAIWVPGAMPAGVSGSLVGSSWVINDGAGATGAVEIPGYYQGYPVSIATFCFRNNTAITSLSLNEGITSIGAEAFNGCSGLSGTLTIPSSVTSIGDLAFYNCNGFGGDLTIPSGVTSIGSRAFYLCHGFSGALTIPSSVKSIGDYAFAFCLGLSGDLTIPSSVTSIGDSVFNSCSGFTGNLTIPSGVTSIGESAFAYCTGFSGDLTIPSSVTSIGSSAFEGCEGITSVIAQPELPPAIGTAVFWGMTLSGIHVPSAAAVTAYQAAPGWSDYAGIISTP